MQPDNSITFHRKDLPCVCFAAFEDMRKKKEFCDLTIRVQNYTFVTHQVILAAGIPYFRTISATSQFEKQSKEIRMDNLDPRAVKSLIHYTYTSRIKVSMGNVGTLLLASEFLNISEIKDACVQFLSERLQFENVIPVFKLALACNSSKLVESCTTYIKNNFEEISKSNSFLNFPYPYIQEVISKDDLNVSNEKVVFEAVMNWVKFSHLERHSVLHQLLSEVRLINLPSCYLSGKAVSEELIRLSVPCTKLLRNAENYHMLSIEELPLLNLHTRQRTNYVKNTVYAFCQSNTECFAYVYDFTNYSWNHAKSISINSKDIYGFASVDDNVYLFLEETIGKFYVSTLEWQVLQSKYDDIRGAAILSHGTVIYCFGIVKSIFESAIHAFDTRQNKWLTERKMMARHSPAAASFGDFIYVTGGIRNFSGHTNACEKYNPLTNVWCEISSMRAPRACHSCAVINDKIYACGGTTGLDYTNTAEVYNTVTNQWNSIASMLNRRSRFSLVSYNNNQLYALGGWNESMKDCMDTEIYDLESNKWTSSCVVPRGFLSAQLIFIPHD